MTASLAFAAAEPSPAPATRSGRPFVGREPEIEALESCLRTASAGRGQLVAVVGEAGIGKTRTVEELLARAALPADRVLWGRCPEEEGVPAYRPWSQAIQSYVERCDPAALRAVLGRAASEVARLVPGVRERLPDVRDVRAPEPAHSRFPIFDGVTVFLQRLAARDAHVLVLDDLHWADDGTMLLLGHVVP